MQETFKLRKFEPDDLQDVMHINRVCLPENYTDMFFMDLHERFPEAFIVAEEDHELIGYIMSRIEVGLSNFGLGGLIRKGHVVSIAVMPQARRKGVATALINCRHGRYVQLQSQTDLSGSAGNQRSWRKPLQETRA